MRLEFFMVDCNQFFPPWLLAGVGDETEVAVVVVVVVAKDGMAPNESKGLGEWIACELLYSIRREMAFNLSITASRRSI